MMFPELRTIPVHQLQRAGVWGLDVVCHVDICFIPRADGHGGIYLGNGLGPVTAESPRHLAALAESR